MKDKSCLVSKKLNMYSADFFQDNMLFMAYVQSLPFNKAMVDIA